MTTDIEKEALEYIERKRNPFKFIKNMWWLLPTNKDDKFVKWVHLTWQQTLIVESVRKAINDEASRKISIASGHGIGKTSISSMLILWFLFCHVDAQVACTSPTQSQMYDVLWKEVAVWINRMPERAQQMFELSADFIRVVERPKTRWARARTARKESPEAIAGIHGESVMILVDEASWVPDEVYVTAKWALTNTNILFIMISNPTRLAGYFFKSHNNLKEDFQTYTFSSIDSPIVDYWFVNDIKKEYGENSDEYRVRVMWQFPNEEAINDEWYMRMFRQDDIKYMTKVDEELPFGQDCIMGVDPAWEGSDETVWVLRDNIHAKILRRENKSTPKGIAQITSTLMTQYNIPASHVVIDNFGVGTDCIQELAMMGIRVYGLFLGKEANDKKTFLNKRAELYRRTRERLKRGGMFVRQDWREELLNIYFRRSEWSNQIQIMPKVKMKKEYGIKSPWVADSLAYTFLIPGLWEWPTMSVDFGIDPRKSPVMTVLPSVLTQ